MKRLIYFLFILAVLTAFSLFLLAVSKDSLPPAVQEKISVVGYESGQDLRQLASRFGTSIPYMSLQGSGQVEDRTYPGGTAQMLTWSDSNGFTVKAVRPANAAALMQDDLLTPTNSLYMISDMAAALFESPLRKALYFGNDTTAYAIYFDASLSVEQFFGALQFTD